MPEIELLLSQDIPVGDNIIDSHFFHFLMGSLTNQKNVIKSMSELKDLN